MSVYFVDCAEVVISASYGGKNINNVLGFWQPSGYDLTALQSLATSVDALVGSDYLPHLNTAVLYESTTARGLSGPTDLSAISFVSAGAGTETGAQLPANASLCVTLRTGFTGRSARGRFYAMPTIGANLVTVQTYAAAYGDAIVDFLTGVQTAASLLGWTLVILSRRTLNAPRAVGVHYTVGTIAYRNLAVDSRRSRLATGH